MRLFWRWILAGLVVLLVCGAIFYQSPLWVNDQALRFSLWRRGVRSDYVEVDGQRLHYFEVPAANGSAGTPILLVHGLGARGEDWGPMLTGLAKAGFHVYAPDLLGYGRSAKPDVSYSISFEEGVVLGFIKAVHLQRPDVAGWSMGGWIAMKLTLDHPELVRRLVIYDSAGLYFNAADGVAVFTPQNPAEVRKLVAILSPKPRTLPEFVARDVVRKNSQIAWVIHRSVAAMMDGTDLLDFKLQGISRPTLVVWGSHDDLIPLAIGQHIYASIPGASLAVIEGCGHLAPAECSRPVLESTVEFLHAKPAPVSLSRTLPGQ